ncbi:hypothetical protein GWI33_005142 [Rhynchophorus ferrugineus]|uniref:Uncharacterized protein n=1 Tax=Rhynchophorus ferrugineus TaxID=354439 RepID=A0A834MJY7_RHYFE|nr:hypothetical protein GWI33_005142 [Rhynchophorus ferrugineus]
MSASNIRFIRDIVPAGRVDRETRRDNHKCRKDCQSRTGHDNSSNGKKLVDRSPSWLQSLAGDAAGHDIIKVIWMNQLDPITRASIVAQSWRSAGGTAPTNNSESQLAEEFARLRLQAKVDEVAEHQRVSFRNRLSSRLSGPNRSRIRGCELYDGLCWYHYDYSERARRCRPGCRYDRSSSANAGNQPGGH